MEARERERVEYLCCAGCSKWPLTFSVKTMAAAAAAVDDASSCSLEGTRAVCIDHVTVVLVVVSRGRGGELSVTLQGKHVT